MGATDSLARIEKFLWLALLLLTPISSSPLLPLGASTQVRPLALIPMGLLLGIAAIRMMFLGQRPNLNGDKGCFALLLWFSAYVLISGLVLVAFLPDELFKDRRRSTVCCARLQRSASASAFTRCADCTSVAWATRD